MAAVTAIGQGAAHGSSVVRPPANDAGAITLERLEGLRGFAARLVLRHGEWLLPIFERIDAECAARERTRSSLDRVRAMAGRTER